MKLHALPLSDRTRQTLIDAMVGRMPRAEEGREELVRQTFALDGPAWITLPHRAYVIELAQAYGEDPIGAAYPVGVRVLLQDGDAVTGTAELPGENIDSGRVDPDVARGPHGAATAKAVAWLETQPGDDDTYEVRYVRVPALSMSIVWLHGDGDSSDWFLDLDAKPRKRIRRSAMNAQIRRTAVEGRASRTAVDEDELGG